MLGWQWLILQFIEASYYISHLLYHQAYTKGKQPFLMLKLVYCPPMSWNVTFSVLWWLHLLVTGWVVSSCLLAEWCTSCWFYSCRPKSLHQHWLHRPLQPGKTKSEYSASSEFLHLLHPVVLLKEVVMAAWDCLHGSSLVQLCCKFLFYLHEQDWTMGGLLSHDRASQEEAAALPWPVSTTEPS